jgi:hypothetical protein
VYTVVVTKKQGAAALRGMTVEGTLILYPIGCKTGLC